MANDKSKMTKEEIALYQAGLRNSSLASREKKKEVASQLLGGDGAAGMAKSFDDSDVERIFSEYDMNAPFLQLEEGKGIEGILHGPGIPRQTTRTDPTTGAVEEVELPTWRIEIQPEVFVDLQSAYQLDRELPSRIGQRVIVIRGKDKNAKAGRRVTQYMVGGKKNQSLTLPKVED